LGLAQNSMLWLLVLGGVAGCSVLGLLIWGVAGLGTFGGAGSHSVYQCGALSGVMGWLILWGWLIYAYLYKRDPPPHAV
jgi:hypothetical protein